ncbi:MAG: WG repeat-containing protein [Proteobacteria bacterium]|nr:WG repeat-containing protein [Pseudomonadota bacterium]
MTQRPFSTEGGEDACTFRFTVCQRGNDRRRDDRRLLQPTRPRAAHLRLCRSRGRTAIEPAFLDARSFSEGACPRCVAAGWGYIDRSGHWVIPPRYSAAAPFAEGRAAVRDAAGRWGYVDPTGQFVVPPQFERLSRFVEGRAWGERPDGQLQAIDRDGRVTPSPASADRASFGDLSEKTSPAPDLPMAGHDLRRLGQGTRRRGDAEWTRPGRRGLPRTRG